MSQSNNNLLPQVTNAPAQNQASTPVSDVSIQNSGQFTQPSQNRYVQYDPVYPNVQYNPVGQNPPTYEQSMDTNTNYSSSKGTEAIPPQNIPQNIPQNHEVVIMINETQVPRHSFKMKCPHCNKTVDTVVKYEDNVLIWALCIILFIFTMLCCIPFCITDLKDAVHYCPICRNEIARRDRVI